MCKQGCVMKPKPAGQRVILLPAALLFVFLGLTVFNPAGLISPAHDAVFDIFQAFHPRPVELTQNTGSVTVIHVDIDAESTARVGDWPWPRRRINELFAKLASAGPRAIGAGFLLSGADPVSPSELAANLSAEESTSALKTALKALPDSDAALADTLRNTNAYGGIYFLKGSGGPALPAPAPLQASDVDPAKFVPAFGSVWTSHAPLRSAFKSTGHVNFDITDSDKPARARYVPLFIRFGNTLYPSLSLEMIRALDGAAFFSAARRDGAADKYAILKQDGLGAVTAGARIIRTEADGSLRLYYNERAGESIPAWRVLNDDIATTHFANAIVVVGASVAGPVGHVVTPSGQLVPASAVHAQAIEQILSGAFLERYDWILTGEYLFIIFIGIALILITARLGALVGGIFFFVSASLGVYVAWMLFTKKFLLADPALPAFIVSVTYIVTAIAVTVDKAAQRRFMLSVMSSHLPDDVAQEFASTSSSAILAGQRRNISFMLCGLRGFERVEERFRDNPKGLADFMHTYLSLLTEVVHERSGTLDKYIGHTIMAFWNAPNDDEQHAFHACETAQRIIVKLETLNSMLENASDRHQQPFFRPLTVSIGINSGTAIVGDMGSKQRLSYTAVGEPVRVACHLQLVSKLYGPAIVVGEGTRERVNRNFAFLEIDYLIEMGQTAPYRVYALLGDSITRASPRFKALEEAHERIFSAMHNRDWSTARAEIAAARTLSGAITTLYDLYEARVAHSEQNPPDEGWNGAHRLNLS